RSEMPDDLDLLLEIAKLDRRDVGEIVVALRWIVVQPANDVVHAGAIDDDGRLTPHDLGAMDCAGELLRDGVAGAAASVPNAFPATTTVKPLLTGRNVSDGWSCRTAPIFRRSPTAQCIA